VADITQGSETCRLGRGQGASRAPAQVARTLSQKEKEAVELLCYTDMVFTLERGRGWRLAPFPTCEFPYVSSISDRF
jgi:hypothetical protein